MVEAEIIAFLSPIVSTLIIWYIQHRHMEYDKKRDELLLAEKRRQEEREKEKEAESNARAEARKQENLLTMRMIKAIGKLSYANSIDRKSVV